MTPWYTPAHPRNHVTLARLGLEKKKNSPDNEGPKEGQDKQASVLQEVFPRAAGAQLIDDAHGSDDGGGRVTAIEFPDAEHQRGDAVRVYTW